MDKNTDMNDLEMAMDIRFNRRLTKADYASSPPNNNPPAPPLFPLPFSLFPLSRPCLARAFHSAKGRISLALCANFTHRR